MVTVVVSLLGFVVVVVGIFENVIQRIFVLVSNLNSKHPQNPTIIKQLHIIHTLSSWRSIDQYSAWYLYLSVVASRRLVERWFDLLKGSGRGSALQCCFRDVTTASWLYRRAVMVWAVWNIRLWDETVWTHWWTAEHGASGRSGHAGNWSVITLKYPEPESPRNATESKFQTKVLASRAPYPQTVGHARTRTSSFSKAPMIGLEGSDNLEIASPCNLYPPNGYLAMCLRNLVLNPKP